MTAPALADAIREAEEALAAFTSFDIERSPLLAAGECARMLGVLLAAVKEPAPEPVSDPYTLPAAIREGEEALRRVLANAATIVRLSWSDGLTPADRANMERIKTAAADIAQDHKILRSLVAAAKATSAHACTSATIEGEPGHESCSVCGHPFPPDSSHALRRCEVRP